MGRIHNKSRTFEWKPYVCCKTFNGNLAIGNNIKQEFYLIKNVNSKSLDIVVEKQMNEIREISLKVHEIIKIERFRLYATWIGIIIFLSQAFMINIPLIGDLLKEKILDISIFFIVALIFSGYIGKENEDSLKDILKKSIPKLLKAKETLKEALFYLPPDKSIHTDIYLEEIERLIKLYEELNKKNKKWF